MSIKSVFAMLGNSDKPAPVSKVSTSSPPASSAPSLSPGAQPVISPAPVKVKKDAPFSKFEITISGFSDNSYRDDSGNFHSRYEYYLNATGSNSYSFPIKISDLMMAGYEVYSLGPCLLRLVYDDSEHYLYCEGDKPQDDSSSTALASLPTP